MEETRSWHLYFNGIDTVYGATAKITIGQLYVFRTQTVNIFASDKINFRRPARKTVVISGYESLGFDVN